MCVHVLPILFAFSCSRVLILMHRSHSFPRFSHVPITLLHLDIFPVPYPHPFPDFLPCSYTAYHNPQVLPYSVVPISCSAIPTLVTNNFPFHPAPLSHSIPISPPTCYIQCSFPCCSHPAAYFPPFSCCKPCSFPPCSFIPILFQYSHLFLI
jgi:hypothetical protein